MRAETFRRVAEPPVHEFEADGSLSLYQAGEARVVVLNGTAAAIWRLIDGTRGPDDIVASLAEAYATSPTAIRLDVEATVRSLCDAGLLTRA